MLGYIGISDGAVEIAQYTRDNNGGTFKVYKGTQTAYNMQAYNKPMYVVSPYKGEEWIIPLHLFTAGNVSDYINYIAGGYFVLSSEYVSIGTWVHEGQVYLDHVKIYNDLDDALNCARQNNQIAIYDLLNGVEIEVN
jgi:hypothetical protein